MRVLLFSIVIAAITALIIPPQVKQITHTYQSTEIRFWYPTFLKVDGEVRFNSKMSVLSGGDIDWSRDQLRSTKFICTRQECEKRQNPVFANWVENEKQITRVTSEAEGFKVAIQKAREQFNAMEKYLKEHSCSEVSAVPPKPAFACAEHEAQEVAATTCFIREFGAKVCEKVGKDALTIDAPKLFKDAVAREGCAAAVHEITGESYNLLDKTIKKYTVDLPVTLLSEFIGWFSQGAKDVFDLSVAGVRTKACIPSGIQLCTAKFSNWQSQVSEHLARFEQQIKYCQQALEIREAAQSAIGRNEAHLVTAENLLSQLRDKKVTLEQQVDRVEMPHALEIL